ncbi:MAG: acetylornithine transaminase [Acidobacteria bacterium]|nr:acetylornithine transaminase [Acidobacteriota bacterium]
MSPKEIEEKAARVFVGTYKRTPFHPRSGSGARLVDADGKEYWDLLAGIAVNALGYAHPDLVSTLQKEAGSLLHVSNLYYHPAPTLLAEKLVELSGMPKVFLCNSGTEANEAAIKFTRLARPGRTRIVSLVESFHGRTLGALALTGHEPYRTPFAPLPSGVVFVPPNDVDALAAAVDENTAAVFLEPIMGEGGVVPMTAEFLAAARRICDAKGALLVLDEIQCGLGRTGTFMACANWGVTPDLVTLAKPLGGGLPLGAVLCTEAVAGAVKPGHHGTTFGGNPLACALGLAMLEVVSRPAFLTNVKELGDWFGGALRELATRVPAIKDVRGMGLMWGIELDREAGPVIRALLAQGFVCGTSRTHVIRLLPPLVVPKAALEAFLPALQSVLEEKP